MDHRSLILEEQYFLSNGHDLDRNAKFTILEIIKKA